MSIKDLYRIMGLNSDATKEELDEAYNDRMAKLYDDKNSGRISRAQFNQAFDDLNNAHDILSNRLEDYDEDYDKPSKRSGLAKKVGAVVVAAAVAVSVFAGAYALGKRNTGAKSNAVGYESESEVPSQEGQFYDPSQDPSQEPTPTPSQEQGEGSEPEQEDGQKDIPAIVHYDDINNETVVREKAATLVDELKAANIVNPTTGSLYTEDEVYTLIMYSWGLYTPETMEEIDVLHLNLLNILISPLNTDEYLYHVAYVVGNDDFKDMAGDGAKVKPDFASAFAEYEENGVYPLTVWMQQQREAIYSTTDKAEIKRIYTEVGQVMADIMKGNGCTITIYEDKDEYTYTYTSEQILANHASALLLTIDAQLVFANNYELRNENGEVIDAVPNVWKVYNKFNGDEPDQVSLDEIQAWINNGCDYEWGIDEVLIDGQTFGQRIQGDMEGMALNNYTMSGNKTLGK